MAIDARVTHQLQITRKTLKKPTPRFLIIRAYCVFSQQPLAPFTTVNLPTCLFCQGQSLSLCYPTKINTHPRIWERRRRRRGGGGCRRRTVPFDRGLSREPVPADARLSHVLLCSLMFVLYVQIIIKYISIVVVIINLFTFPFCLHTDLCFSFDQFSRL